MSQSPTSKSTNNSPSSVHLLGQHLPPLVPSATHPGPQAPTPHVASSSQSSDGLSSPEIPLTPVRSHSPHTLGIDHLSRSSQQHDCISSHPSNQQGHSTTLTPILLDIPFGRIPRAPIPTHTMQTRGMRGVF